MEIHKGLDNVIVKESTICLIDPDNCKIYYRGYDLEDLVEYSTFEETSYLILYGKLPKRSELEAFIDELTRRREPPRHVIELMRVLPRRAEPIDVLRTAVSAMGLEEDLSDKSPEAELNRGLRIIATAPFIAGNWDRIRRGLDIMNPSVKNTAEYLLALLRDGKEVTPIEIRALDALLVIYAEHGMNNSSFTAVTVSSTLSDMYSAITAALASLKGPLHGGANVDAARVLDEIGDPKNVERWVDNAIAKKTRIPGFGHRVYKRGPDPRVKLLRRLSEELASFYGDYRYLEIAEKLEDCVRCKLAHKGVYPNVDLYAAVVLKYLGIPADMNIVIFAIARVVGWVAHVVEYRANNRLIRPREKYVGPIGLKYVPIEERDC